MPSIPKFERLGARVNIRVTPSEREELLRLGGKDVNKYLRFGVQTVLDLLRQKEAEEKTQKAS